MNFEEAVYVVDEGNTVTVNIARGNDDGTTAVSVGEYNRLSQVILFDSKTFNAQHRYTCIYESVNLYYDKNVKPELLGSTSLISELFLCASRGDKFLIK